MSKLMLKNPTPQATVESVESVPSRRQQPTYKNPAAGSVRSVSYKNPETGSVRSVSYKNPETGSVKSVREADVTYKNPEAEISYIRSVRDVTYKNPEAETGAIRSVHDVSYKNPEAGIKSIRSASPISKAFDAKKIEKITPKTQSARASKISEETLSDSQKELIKMYIDQIFDMKVDQITQDIMHQVSDYVESKIGQIKTTVIPSEVAQALKSTPKESPKQLIPAPSPQQPQLPIKEPQKQLIVTQLPGAPKQAPPELKVPDITAEKKAVSSDIQQLNAKIDNLLRGLGGYREKINDIFKPTMPEYASQQPSMMIQKKKA